MKHRPIDVHGVSVRGSTNDRNEDHFAIATLRKSMHVHQSNLTIDDDSRLHGRNQGHLFLVADGISSGPAPDRASGTAIDALVRYFLNEMPWYRLADGTPLDVKSALEEALRNAQDELLKTFTRSRERPGSTVTLAFVLWPHLFVAHAGDSRCYLVRNGEMSQLTTDHTMAKVPSGARDVEAHGSDQILWNAVGGLGREIFPEVCQVQLSDGDVLALVTDGVTKTRSREELAATLASEVSADDACARLLRGPSGDDRTAIVVRFPRTSESSEPLRPAAPPQLDAHLSQPNPKGRVSTRPSVAARRYSAARKRA